MSIVPNEIIDTMEHILDITRIDAGLATGVPPKDALRYRLTAVSMALQYICATAEKPFETLEVMTNEMKSERGIDFMNAVIRTPIKDLK